MIRRGILCFLGWCLVHGTLFASGTSVLELSPAPEERAPDILFLAPRLVKPANAYGSILASLAKVGACLPNAPLSERAFCEMGPLPILAKRGYRLLPVRDVPWEEAVGRLQEIFTLRRKIRLEDGVQQAPLCVILCEEVTPEVLKATLPMLLAADAFILLAPQDDSLPLTVIWENHVWPTQRSEQTLRIEHWVATFADLVGLPAPADCGEVSILPLLTGSGFQRSLEQPLLLGPSATMAQKVAPCTMVGIYAKLPEACAWVPDFTDFSRLKPTKRFFVSSALPLAEEEVPLLKAVDQPQGLYVRSVVSELTVTLPPQVSCVVRVKGHPIFSEWQPTTEKTWQFSSPEPQIVEFFIVLPPDCDPIAALPFLFASAKAESGASSEAVKDPVTSL